VNPGSRSVVYITIQWDGGGGPIVEHKSTCVYIVFADGLPSIEWQSFNIL